MAEFLSSGLHVEDVDDDNDGDEELPNLVTIPDPDKKVPVTILTGFLGSGKTTLLNYILSANHGKKIAVIENEFSGGLGIEGMIAKSGLDGGDLNGFFELNNGCICCTVKEDLLTTLEQLVMHKDRFDYIIIETTGVANPGPVITTFWSDDAIESSLKLDGVVCVVDSLNIQSYLQTEDIANDVRMQISYAGNHFNNLQSY
jgi:G3E family GTPase